MLVWDPISERNLPFGTLKTAALGKSFWFTRIRCCLPNGRVDRSKKELNPRPCCECFVFPFVRPTLITSAVKVFDLLYLNGQSLLQKSLKFRKRNLRACITEVKGRLELTVEYEGKTAQDVRQRMEDIMNNRGEGLVIKHPDSEYVLNGRNKDWIKVCTGDIVVSYQIYMDTL